MPAFRNLTDPELDRWLSTTMAEYKTLRDESLQAQRQQHEAVRIGYTAIALLTGLSAGLGGRAVAPTILLIAVPLLAVGTTIVWLGELGRMVRVGAYLVERERAINDALASKRSRRRTRIAVLGGVSKHEEREMTPLPTPALGWESVLREDRHPRQRLVNLYKATFINLASLGIGAAIAGVVLLFLGHSPRWLITLIIVGEAIGGIVVVVYFYRAQAAIRHQGRGLYPGLR
jgi:hypothetical protein